MDRIEVCGTLDPSSNLGEGTGSKNNTNVNQQFTYTFLKALCLLNFLKYLVIHILKINNNDNN